MATSGSLCSFRIVKSLRTCAKFSRSATEKLAKKRRDREWQSCWQGLSPRSAKKRRLQSQRRGKLPLIDRPKDQPLVSRRSPMTTYLKTQLSSFLRKSLKKELTWQQLTRLRCQTHCSSSRLYWSLLTSRMQESMLSLRAELKRPLLQTPRIRLHRSKEPRARKRSSLTQKRSSLKQKRSLSMRGAKIHRLRRSHPRRSLKKHRPVSLFWVFLAWSTTWVPM